MEFDEFAERAERIEELAGDIEKTEEVASLLREANDEIGVAARFVQGRIFPSWDDRNLSVGPSLLYDALALAGDLTADEIEERVADVGDVGEVAEELDFGEQRTLGSTADSLSDVYETFESIAGESGEGSQEAKVRALGNLFMDSSGRGAKYLARLVLGEMRVGVGEGTVRDAVVEAFDVDAELVRRGIMVTNDVGEVAETARDEGDEGLGALEMEVGRPVKPMLAQAGTVEGVFEDVSDEGEVAVEWKYDGARLQVHHGEEETELYSRNLEDLTDSLPDVVKRVEEDTEEDTILDAEVVAVGDDGKPLPFQQVLRRLRRKYDVEEMQEEVELKLYVFDILYRDGEAVIDLPLRGRYEALEETVEETRAHYTFAGRVEEVRAEEAEAIERGHEGVMAKNPASPYSPGRRGKNWLKLKPEPETLDLVVTGGEWGEGRRANNFGTYTLSVRDGDELETMGKVATGITDEKLEDLTERFEPLVESEDGMEVEFAPEVVFEVGYEEIQESPKYTSGYALRFPRFLGVRDDKNVEDADSLERVERIYES